MSGSDDVADRRSQGAVPPPSYVADFAADWAAAVREARLAKDASGQERLVELWFDYFESTLPSLGVGRLVEYLESRRVWRKYDKWPVYKTADTPCLAFTASLLDGNGKVILVALGCCYKYPADDEDEWWRNVILPRVRSL